MTERGHLVTPDSSGGQTLPANNGATAFEITIPDESITAVVVTPLVAARAAVKAAGTGAAGAGKDAVQGSAYVDLAAGVPVEIPCVGGKRRNESVYVCAFDTSASTFSFAYVYGGER